MWDAHGSCGGRWGIASATRPNQNFAVFVHGETLGLDDLHFQVFEVVIIEREAALQGAIGDAPLAPGKVEDLGEDLVEYHLRPRCLRIGKGRRQVASSLAVRG
jgi:hypothetical protein